MSMHSLSQVQSHIEAKQHVLEGYALGCGRSGLHMCQIRQAEQLSALWPWIKKGLVEIAEKNQRRAHWLPEHVRMEIALGLAGQNAVECYVGHDSDAQAETVNGFIVVYPLMDPFVKLPLTLFVWMGNMSFPILEKILPEFEALARSRGFLRWEWITSRVGWAKMAAKFGAEIVQYTIAKEL